jgi:hypothetical protein
LSLFPLVLGENKRKVRTPPKTKAESSNRNRIPEIFEREGSSTNRVKIAGEENIVIPTTGFNNSLFECFH